MFIHAEIISKADSIITWHSAHKNQETQKKSG